MFCRPTSPVPEPFAVSVPSLSLAFESSRRASDFSDPLKSLS